MILVNGQARKHRYRVWHKSRFLEKYVYIYYGLTLRRFIKLTDYIITHSDRPCMLGLTRAASSAVRWWHQFNITYSKLNFGEVLRSFKEGSELSASEADIS
jgi:hypothetical protein